MDSATHFNKILVYSTDGFNYKITKSIKVRIYFIYKCKIPSPHMNEQKYDTESQILNKQTQQVKGRQKGQCFTFRVNERNTFFANKKNNLQVQGKNYN